MHAFNVLLQSSPRVALEKEHDRNKAATGFFFFFFSEFYQNADGTRGVLWKETLFKIHSPRPSCHLGIKFELIKNTSTVKLLECFALCEQCRHYGINLLSEYYKIKLQLLHFSPRC